MNDEQMFEMSERSDRAGLPLEAGAQLGIARNVLGKAP